MSEPALALAGIQRTFHQGEARLEVLKGVDLAIQPGEIAALLGPSGAGKSTLLQIAGLLEPADDGSLKIGGREVSGLKDGDRTAIRRSDLGFVYQFHHLLPEFSALENVMMPLRLAGQGARPARERARALLAQVGLTAREDHRPARLSGGEQQRVAIARALANAPKVLLADEPTGNLDSRTADDVFGLLLGLVRRERLAALIATHNEALAARMDRAVRLSDGRLVAA